MKTSIKIFAVTLIASLVTLFGSNNLHADSNNELIETFTQEVEGIHQGIEKIAKTIGDALEDNEVQESALAHAFNEIQEHANTLVELAHTYDQPWQSEAEKIVESCDDLKAELEEQEFDEMVTVLIRIGIFLDNMEMMVPRYLRDTMERLTLKLKSELAEGDADWDDLESIVEKLILHARQLSFAADAFGKIVWKKFSDPLWELCVELDEAVEDGDEEEIAALLEEMERPLKMLSKLIK